MRTMTTGLEEVASEWPPEVPRAMPALLPRPPPRHHQTRHRATLNYVVATTTSSPLRRCHNDVVAAHARTRGSPAGSPQEPRPWLSESGTWPGGTG